MDMDMDGGNFVIKITTGSNDKLIINIPLVITDVKNELQREG